MPITIQPSSLRKDKARSRAAILNAARELFSCGRDVPVYEIGRGAGVGHATLYRHFPSRSAIIATLYRHFPSRSAIIATLSREHVDQIEATAAHHEHDDDALLVVLYASADMLVCNHDVLGILREDATLAPVLHELRQRMRTLLDTTVNRSRAGQVLRDDVQVDDLLLLLNMINGALTGITTREQRTAAAHRALEISLNGLRHRPRPTDH